MRKNHRAIEIRPRHNASRTSEAIFQQLTVIYVVLGGHDRRYYLAVAVADTVAAVLDFFKSPVNQRVTALLAAFGLYLARSIGVQVVQLY